MNYVGIDFHKNYSFITEMDEDGKISHQAKITNDCTTLKNYLAGLSPGTKIAIEATCNWYYFYELVEDQDLEVMLAHPLKTKAIASARLMNDKVSSETLAHLRRADLLPAAYIPDKPTRDIREVLRLRAFLTILRTRLKNRVHAVLLKNGIPCPYSDIFGKRSLIWLNELTLRPCYQNAINSCLCLATRSMHASGGKVRMGSITKQGSRWLRWILVEAASHAIKKSDHYEKLYSRVAYKHGKTSARVAVARSICRAIYAMLKFNRPYQERQLRSAPWGHNRQKGSRV